MALISSIYGNSFRQQPVQSRTASMTEFGRRTARLIGSLARIRSPRLLTADVEQTGSVLHGTRTPIRVLGAYPLLIEFSII